MPRPRRQNAPPVALIATLGAAAVAAAAAAYFYFSSAPSSKESLQLPHKQISEPKKKTSTQQVAIILSKDLIENGDVPFADLLAKFPNLVFIYFPADFSEEGEEEEENEDLPRDIEQLQLPDPIAEVIDIAKDSYKFLPCGTATGATHIVKHLRPQVLVVPRSHNDREDRQVKEQDVTRFVGSVQEIEDDAADFFASMLV
ncbi:uncharacterized protein SAPINGB_P003996 [Magnusiomyces paraingens]|uniref:Peroxisome assembly protein 22 n=1 Tax=Magnusiomyces paraingens TaxID=2606893 RepID=A0A5E8BUG0_9ASCO|nr:uncharacterized protein SAPINGB_P003996 [Saprochaete ingens]VVT54279.1 unnamed protein product [Saprochaete ingens]